MSEKPILFSGAMVRAILSGAKTQTRRLVKQQVGEVIDGVAWYPDYYEVNGDPGSEHRIPSPCSVGDTLWVKETWRVSRDLDHVRPVEIPDYESRPAIHYLADTHRESDPACPRGKTRVSIHMPRWASRLSLRVTDVRVERLGDISEADARAEGAVHAFAAANPNEPTWHPLRCFPWLWCQVHGPDAWERDRRRWVWVYSFEVAA